MASAHGHRWPIVSALTRFWADDKGLSIFSALLLIVAFILPPLVPAGSGRSLAGDLIYALLLISGVPALGERKAGPHAADARRPRHAGGGPRELVRPLAEPWVLGTSLVSLLLFLSVVLGQTLRDGPVTFHRLHGAVAAYLLLGIIWAYAYALVALLRPGGVLGAGQRRGRPPRLLLLQLRDAHHRRLR